MSEEHVAEMNALLLNSESVRAACADLDEPRRMQYDLRDGPDGVDVHWLVTFDRTLSFGLDPHPQPDITITCDWADMIRTSAASRAGEATSPSITVEGDGALLAQLSAILEVGRAVATVDVVFPRLP